MKDGGVQSPIHTDQEKIDGIIGLTSTLVRLHGTCMHENTNDEHPPGGLRVNRVVMGSPEFRHSFCGKNAPPPQTPGAKTSCEGL
jgi:hypothetical protein